MYFDNKLLIIMNFNVNKRKFFLPDNKRIYFYTYTLLNKLFTYAMRIFLLFHLLQNFSEYLVKQSVQNLYS